MTNLQYIKSLVEFLKIDASKHKRLYTDSVIPFPLILSMEATLEEYEKDNIEDFFEREFKQIKEIE